MIERKKLLVFAFLAAAIVGQAVLPGFIGLADNRDFAKVAGKLCLGHDDSPSSYYEVFQTTFQREARYCWPSGIATSEYPIAGVASWVQQRFGNRSAFDIRWLGGIHAAIYLLGGFMLLAGLRELRGARWWIISLLSILILCDVAFTAYFNTFYTDAVALAGAMLLTGAAFGALAELRPRGVFLAGYVIGALLLVTSKGQHAALAPLLVMAPVVFWRPTRRRLWLSLLFAATLLVAAAWTLRSAPEWYGGQARFNIVFTKILPGSPDPQADLQELGLEASDLPYVGQHAFLPSSPAFDAAWLLEFSRRFTWVDLARFWATHPVRILGAFCSDLESEAPFRRPQGFSILSARSNGQLSLHNKVFTAWSSLRMWVALRWPYVTPLLLAAILLAGFRMRVRSDHALARAAAGVAIVAVLLAAASFVTSALGDAHETDRHLILHHFFADIAILAGAICVASSGSRRGLLPVHDR